MNVKKAALLLMASALLTASSFAENSLSPATFTVPAGTTQIAGTTTYGVAAGSSLEVTINPSVDAAACYYTTDGQAVTIGNTDVTEFAGPVTVALAQTGLAKTPYIVNVLCTASGYKSSTAKFSPTLETQVGTPILSPNGSTGPHAVTVTVPWSSATGGHATVKYTTDGSDPAVSTTAIAAKYAAATNNFSLGVLGDSNQTVTVVATGVGYLNSAEVAAVFGSSYAATSDNFIAAGSSAQFNEYALAFGGVLGNGAASGGACGAHHFTKSNGAQAVDQRSGQTPADTGNLLIVWDNSNDPTVVTGNALYPAPAAPSKICVYLSLDSTLGVKAFMNSNLAVPAEFLNITGTSGTSNSISPFWFAGNDPSNGNATDDASTVALGATPDEAKIPSDVLAAAQGQPFNVAVTDIRPEDAKFATTRALTTLNAARTGLGYGPGPLGNAVVSVAGTTFNVVDFALSGKDPISGAKQNAYTTVPIGAAPVVVFVNKSVAADGTTFHFSSSEVKNISRFTLAKYLNGTLTGTGALATSAIAPLVSGPVNVWLREPLSGTYNTMEFNVPASKELAAVTISQENGVDPTVKGTCTGGSTTTFNTCTGTGDANGNYGNPLFITIKSGMTGVLNATRQRAIGTGEEVKQVAGKSADSLGYAFWGYGNFKSGNNSATTTTKYLTVDGVDPIQAEYSSGSYPTCTAGNYNPNTGGCPQTLSFPNVVNGSYPIWSIYRAVTQSPVPSFVQTVLTAAENASSTVQDFAPLTQMQVFRSHYTQAGVAPSNGVATAVETGGDVGGAVFTIQADLDYAAENAGTELVNIKQ